MINNIVLFIILLIVIFEAGAMYCIKEYHILGNVKLFGLGILFYAMVCYLLNKSFEYDGIAKVNIIWSALSVLASTIIGVMIFKEVLHIHDYIAIGLITTGILILRITK